MCIKCRLGQGLADFHFFGYATNIKPKTNFWKNVSVIGQQIFSILSNQIIYS